MTDKALPPARRPFPMPYVMIWAVLASLSLAYLTILVVEPALISGYFGASPAIATPQSNEGQRAATDAVAEINSLRESVDQVQDDLENLRAELSSRVARERELTARLSALEAAPEMEAEKAETARATQAKSKDKATTVAKSAAGRDSKVARPAGTVLMNAPGIVTTTGASRDAPTSEAPKPSDRAPIETGSVSQADAAPVKFGPATVTRESKPVGLQIATGPSVDSLRLSWTLLADRHGDSLRSLEPRYTTGKDDSGTTYDLVVGPIGSAAEAKRMCKELGEKGTSCKVGDFTGEAL